MQTASNWSNTSPIELPPSAFLPGLPPASRRNQQKIVRVLSFKVPLAAQKPPLSAVRSDRSLTWELMKQLGPCDTNKRSPPSPKEELVLAAFRKLPDSLLDIPDASSLPLPFTYHSTVNDDKSYVTQPRLSVSKLLTNSWCELANFFDIYAGLPRIDSGRLQVGRNYHQHLEDQTHAQVDKEDLYKLVDEEMTRFSEDERAALMKNTMGMYLGEHWMENGVIRLLSATKEHFAREVYVHGFINFYTGQLATTPEELLTAVLVNGIADIVKIDRSNTASPYTNTFSRRKDLQSFLIEDLQLQLQALRLDKLQLVDLAEEVPRVKSEATKLSKDHYIHIRDVKTRAFNEFPRNSLMVEAARDQCLYYAQFLANLSQSPEFAYASHLENAKRREVDVDEPLGVALAVQSIITQFPVMVLDMKRLARGEPIGFNEFDEFQKTRAENTEAADGEKPFSISNFVTEARFREMLALFYSDSKELMEVDILDLFRPWKHPLTVRYFAARAGQAYNIFESFRPASVCIEYHNFKSRRVFGYKHFPFSLELLAQSMVNASRFWSGQRLPKATDDLTKCRRCDFRTRCPAINKPVDALAGDAIYKLIEM